MLKAKALLISVLAGGLLAAQAVYAEVSVVFVNTPKVVEEAPQAQAARERLQQEFAPREAELIAAQKKLKALDEKHNRDGSTMSEEQRRKLEREIMSQQRELKRARDELNEDLNIRRNEEFTRLQRTVAGVIIDLAKEKKYDLVLENGVVYNSQRVDITAEVIERLQKRFDAEKKKSK